MRARCTSNVRGSTKEFLPFRLDTANERLWRRRDEGGDERIGLTPKAFVLLRYLVEHSRRLVTRDELLEAGWPDTFVQPEVLKSHIRDIRRALGDDPKNPHFIETFPKRGYGFIAPVKEAPTGIDSVEELHSSRIVGRRVELDELHRCLRQSLASQRTMVFITGELGIGKTTLADEFLRQSAAVCSDIRIARGQCVEGHGSKEAYYPMLEVISQLCGGCDGESVVQTLSAQAPTWLVQFPALMMDEQRKTLQRELAGATRERMLREMADALDTIASKKPLLLVFEDLHWADLWTVDLISALARRRGPAKLMLIGTYRNADVAITQHPLKTVKQDLLVHQLCREIAPKPLNEAEVAEYLAIGTANVPVPRGLSALIHQYCEGNPLFMVAALDHLRDRDLITIKHGTWQIKAPLESIHLETPECLRQMIELQIEHLSTEERRVLEVASVAGASFMANINALETTVDQATFETVCEELSRRQCMVRRAELRRAHDGTISEGYEFLHAFYREVFYCRQAAGCTGLRLRIGETAVGTLTLPA